MHPIKSGQGWLPRYGGGWMHQFGHIYALQQELLNPHASNWFHAMELWHTARTEGVAMNVAHTRNILRQCAQQPCQSWRAALKLINQQEREHIRLDVICVGCVLAMCAEARQAAEVERIFAKYNKLLKYDSICYLALIRARMESENASGAIEVGKMQSSAHVPFLPYTYTYLLEACVQDNDEEYACELVRQMNEEKWQPSLRAQNALKQLHASFHMEELLFFEEQNQIACKEENKVEKLKLLSNTPETLEKDEETKQLKE